MEEQDFDSRIQFEFKGEDDFEVEYDKRVELHKLLYNSKAPSKYPIIVKANRHFQAMDPETDPSELDFMSTLPENDVRLAVASNPSADPSTLDRLAKDHKTGVVHQASMNPSLPDEAMMRLLALDQYENANVLIHTGIALNPNAPDEVLIKLASHQSMLVRQRLLERERIPQEVFKKLFLASTPAQAEEEIRRIDEGRSMLDFVSEEAKQLNTKISAADRHRVDEYFNSVRDVERQLKMGREWVKRPKPE